MTADYNPHAIATADQLKAARAAVDTINDLKQRVEELERCAQLDLKIQEVAGETITMMIDRLEELERYDAYHRQHAATINISIGNLIERVDMLTAAVADLGRQP